MDGQKAPASEQDIDAKRRAWNVATYRRLHPKPDEKLELLEQDERIAALEYWVAVRTHERQPRREA